MVKHGDPKLDEGEEARIQNGGQRREPGRDL
jgi:hypothetical protein